MREDVMREDVMREDVMREDVMREDDLLRSSRFTNHGLCFGSPQYMPQAVVQRRKAELVSGVL